MTTQPDVLISSYDLNGIEAAIEKAKLAPAATAALETELARATVVALNALPKDRVSMGSRVTFKIAEADKVFSKTLCYPEYVSQHEDGISIFSPVGSALIGIAVGQTIEWPAQRNIQHVEVIEVQQPQ